VEIVFVGGAERSGPSALGAALGAHPHYAELPVEAGFHCEPRGLAGLLEGRVRLSGFLDELRGRWWQRTDGGGGLAQVIDGEAFEAAAERFAGSFHDDPVPACRTLFAALIGPWMQRSGRPCLVERTPRVIWRAQTLRRLFPDALFVHALRDGREVAAAIAAESGADGHPWEGIDRWVERLRAIDAGARGEEDGARYDIGGDRLTAVVVDDLASGTAERAADLAGFLGPGGAGVERELGERLRAAIPESGAWRPRLGRMRCARVDRRYERALGALANEHNHAAPPLLAALRREA
jgi:hypothetical protein